MRQTSGLQVEAACPKGTKLACLFKGVDRVDPDSMRAELERLQQENAALKERAGKGLSLRVSEKGALSVYGLGRFPVTLYKEQWNKLLDMEAELRAFMRDNDDKLKARSA